MRTAHLGLFLVLCFITLATGQYPLDYKNLPMLEDTCIIAGPGSALTEVTGTRKILWVVCAADSETLQLEMQP